MRELLYFVLVLLLIALFAYLGGISNSTIDVILHTDSCHFYLDSANFVIDELKIDYVK